jgi:hypothetical protein
MANMAISALNNENFKPKIFYGLDLKPSIQGLCFQQYILSFEAVSDIAIPNSTSKCNK